MRIDKRLQANEKGFTLIEAMIAMVVLLVGVLGVFITFTYAVNYNNGNNDRLQSLAVLQQEVEILKGAKFNSLVMATELEGGAKSAKVVTVAGQNYVVQQTVDDDPSAAGVQIDNTKSLKEITVNVRPESSTTGGTTMPVSLVVQRARGN